MSISKHTTLLLRHFYVDRSITLALPKCKVIFFILFNPPFTKTILIICHVCACEYGYICVTKKSRKVCHYSVLLDVTNPCGQNLLF